MHRRSYHSLEIFMNRILAPLAIAGFMLTASYAFADEEVSEAGMAQQHKMLQACVAKRQASHTQMTKDEIDKACRDEIKSHKDSQDKMSGDTQK
jgi:hypothetical protein